MCVLHVRARQRVTCTLRKKHKCNEFKILIKKNKISFLNSCRWHTGGDLREFPTQLVTFFGATQRTLNLEREQWPALATHKHPQRYFRLEHSNTNFECIHALRRPTVLLSTLVIHMWQFWGLAIISSPATNQCHAPQECEFFTPGCKIIHKIMVCECVYFCLTLVGKPPTTVESIFRSRSVL